jgi:predicted O-methyltransferase YrrM
MGVRGRVQGWSIVTMLAGLLTRLGWLWPRRRRGVERYGSMCARGCRVESVMRTGLVRSVGSILILALLLDPSPSPLVAAEKASKPYNKPYAFTKNTFTDKIPAWTNILEEFKGKPGIHYLEIGTFEGRSALWVLENILTHPTARLTIIDAFVENNYKTFIANVNLSGESGKFKTLVGASTEKIREVPFNSIDFAYIDGSGRGIVMLSDFVSTWNVVKVNGLIICSRYSMTGPLRRALALQANDPGPHEAIDAFLKMYNTYINVVAAEGNYVVVRKKRE